MTIIEGETKNVRRLELDTTSGTLKWKVPKFLFIVGEERVVLKEARVRYTPYLCLFVRPTCLEGPAWKAQSHRDCCIHAMTHSLCS